MSQYNKYGRLCEGKKALSDDLRQLIVTDIKDAGGDPKIGTVPWGIFSNLSAKYRVSRQTWTQNKSS